MLSSEEVVKVSILVCPDLNISMGEPYNPYRKVINRYRITEEQFPIIPIFGRNINIGYITKDNQIIFRKSWSGSMHSVSIEYIKRLETIYKVKQLGKYKFQISSKE